IQIGQTSGAGMPAGRAIASSVDVAETADQIVVSCDVPGVDKEDIKIDIKNNVLTIRGERKNKIERSGSSDDYQYHHQEIQFGGFERSFVLPDQVDPSSAVAEHKNGVLTVRINKIEGKEPIRVPIQ
ncbi:MAG: Hsp20/alpha crystallin family protein, partial [Candidatus Omnitrophica bacterium]|nr:Hsp20/alpha crystallin family protein [Candidatus Omnitrophota bacterium]